MSFLQNLDWRYATKQFDTTKRVSKENLDAILNAIHLTPTSFGIQPYSVIVVSDKELQEKLQAASYNQPQVGTASEVIVFVAHTDLKAIADDFFDELSGGDSAVRENLAGYEKVVNDGIEYKYSKDPLRYASEQAHISLGFAMAAAAELQVDSCAMGGFDANEYAKILGLPENQVPCVVLPIGYRDENESPRPKFRKSVEKVIAYVQ